MAFDRCSLRLRARLTVRGCSLTLRQAQRGPAREREDSLVHRTADDWPQGETMIRSGPLLSAGGALAIVLAFAAPGAAQPANAPNLQSGPGGWTHPFGGAFPAVQGSAVPVQQDSRHTFVNPVVSFRFGDISNPNLRQWAKEAMKKDNDEIDAGKIQFTANSSCLPSGVPVFMLLPGLSTCSRRPPK